ncbi:MAG: hypothetical protein PHD67_07345 [Oscillospiraceae bacterium]|nr:hypothetical protein [Oscillospiraceae bacterium]
MDKQYSVDDILAEIKRKKSGGEGGAAPSRREEGSLFSEPARSGAPETARPAADPPSRAPEAVRPPARPAAEKKKAAPTRPVADDPFDLGKYFGAGADFSTLPEKEAPRTKKAPAQVPPRRVEKPAPAEIPAPRREERSAPPTEFPTPRREERSAPPTEIPPLRAEKEPFRLDPSFARRFSEDGGEPEEDLERTKLDIPVAVAPRRGSLLDDTRDIPSLGPDFLAGGEDEDYYLEEENEDSGEIDDYTGPQDIPDIKEDFRRVKSGLVTRFSITFLLFLVLLYFSAAEYLGAPLPEFLSPAEQPRMFLIAGMVPVVLAALVCNTVIGGGLLSFFTLRADNDSLAALAVIATLVQGIALILVPEYFSDSRIDVYFTMAVLGLVCNTVGKLLVVNRISENFKMVSGPGGKKAVLLVKDRELAQDLARGLDVDMPVIAANCDAGFLRHFLDQSYSADSTEGVSRILAPIVAAGALVIAVASYFLSQNIFVALTNFAACMVISAPVSAAFVGNLPLYRASRALALSGGMLSGFDAVETFSEANTAAVEASDLFPETAVQLHNIKMFEKNRIDEAILDAASVVCSCNGTLQGIFMKIIQNNTAMLKKVENLTYEDGMGLSAWVDGKRVLIGNGDLMRHHDIDTPSRDYELKYRTGDRELIYLANSGELIAMFVVSYSADEQVARALYSAERRGLMLVVKSTDPNLTARKIVSVFDLPEDMVRVLPSKLHGDFDHVTAPRDTAKAGLANCGGACGFLSGLSAAIGVKSAIDLGMILQIVGVVLGYGIVAFFSLMGGIQQVNVFTIMGFQLLWGAGVLFFPNMRKLA